MRGHVSDIEKDIVCPSCKRPMSVRAASWTCEHCSKRFPVAGGKAVLIDDRRSVFDPDSVRVERHEGEPPVGRLRSLARRATPSLTANWCAEHNMKRLAGELASRVARPRVLVVGAGDGGAGVDALVESEEIAVFSTDVIASQAVDIVADAHDLPFGDATFDAVVLQAVLEHVADPFRCVSEAFRVLRQGGLVYAETPFMYPGHMGAYDFHRFSMSGHRRLFRRFAQVDAGVGAGPGTAAALAIRSLLESISSRRLYRLTVLNVAPFVLGWLKYLDRYLADKPQSADFACTLYFLGEKSETELDDRQIIASHWTNRSGALPQVARDRRADAPRGHVTEGVRPPAAVESTTAVASTVE